MRIDSVGVSPEIRGVVISSLYNNTYKHDTDVTHLYRTRVCVLRHERMKGALFLRFARIVYAFICPDGYLPSQQKTRLKRLFEARAVVVRISRRHVCHLCRRTIPMPYRLVAYSFVCCKMCGQHLARNEAARFYYPHFARFCFLSFLFRLVCFLLLCFLPCFLSCLFRSFSFLVRCFPCLVFLSFFAYYCYYLIIIIIIKTLISFVCARTRARTWSCESKAQKKRAAKKPP